MGLIPFLVRFRLSNRMDKIEVVFGPYYINRILKGNYDYRLKGLKSKLAELNAIYTQFDDENRLVILKNGDEVYECKVTDLDYGGDGEFDPFVAEISKRVLVP